MADMTLREAEELIAKIRKAKLDELTALQKAWPEPTEKQARRLAKLKDEFQKVCKHHQKIKKLLSRYGEDKWCQEMTTNPWCRSCPKAKETFIKKSSASPSTNVPWTRSWSAKQWKKLPPQGGKLGVTSTSTTSSSAGLTQKRWKPFHLFFIILYIIF